MGQRIEIRRAQPEDAEAIVAHTRVLVAEKLDTILMETPYTPEQARRLLEECEAAGSVSLLALEGSRVVGMCDLRRGGRKGNRHMGVLGMGVLAGYRGQGIGRALLTRMIAEARLIEGFCRIELGVTPWNVAAIALYESLGFESEGVKRKGIATRGVPEDDLMMALVW